MREFGQLESAIMDVIWAGNRPYAVREVRERMTYGRQVAYTTVMTVMGILYGKGVLRREQHGRAAGGYPGVDLADGNPPAGAEVEPDRAHRIDQHAAADPGGRAGGGRIGRVGHLVSRRHPHGVLDGPGADQGDPVLFLEQP